MQLLFADHMLDADRRAGRQPAGERTSGKADDQRLGHIDHRSGVHGLSHDEVRDEADGVEEGDEKYEASYESVKERNQPAGGVAPDGLVDRLGLGHGVLRSVAIAQVAIEKGRGIPAGRPKDFALCWICPGDGLAYSSRLAA
jgi:hypothetical protein